MVTEAAGAEVEHAGGALDDLVSVEDGELRSGHLVLLRAISSESFAPSSSCVYTATPSSR